MNYLRVYDLKNAVEFLKMNFVVEEKTSIEKIVVHSKRKLTTRLSREEVIPSRVEEFVHQPECRR